MAMSYEISQREYNNYRRALKAKNMYSISDDALSLPEFTFDPSVSRKDVNNVYYVQGIEDEKYSALNGEIVYGWYWKGISGNANNLVKRKRKSFERLDLTEDSKEIWGRADKPAPYSIGVLSSKNIGLPYGYSPAQGSGLGFADKWEDSGETEYGYYIPNNCLYKVNLTSLIVSPVTNTGGGYGAINAYLGKVYQTWEFGNILVAYAPYKKPTKSSVGDTEDITRRRNRIRILGVKQGIDWDNEYYQLIQYLRQQGIIPMEEQLSQLADLTLVQDYQTMQDPYQMIDPMSVGDRIKLAKGVLSDE